MNEIKKEMTKEMKSFWIVVAFLSGFCIAGFFSDIRLVDVVFLLFIGYLLDKSMTA